MQPVAAAVRCVVILAASLSTVHPFRWFLFCSKYRDASQKPTCTLIDEAGFIELLESSLPPDQRPNRAMPAVEALETAAATASPDDLMVEELGSPPANDEDVSAPTFSAAAAAPSSSSASAAGAAAGASSSSSRLALVRAPAVSSLWVDKYAPRRPADYIGNIREMNALSDWLRNWDDVHLAKPANGEKDKKPGFRAALLSGPPGIGE